MANALVSLRSLGGGWRTRIESTLGGCLGAAVLLELAEGIEFLDARDCGQEEIAGRVEELGIDLGVAGRRFGCGGTARWGSDSESEWSVSVSVSVSGSDLKSEVFVRR